jgi:hypothetical protein
MDGSAVPAGVIADAVAAAKAYLRLESDGEDALIARLAASAILLGEAYCGQVIVARTGDGGTGGGTGGDGGAATWAAVPPAVAQGVVMLAAYLFLRPDEDRAPPAAVAALWRPYRRIRIGGEQAA